MKISNGDYVHVLCLHCMHNKSVLFVPMKYHVSPDMSRMSFDAISNENEFDWNLWLSSSLQQ